MSTDPFQELNDIMNEASSEAIQEQMVENKETNTKLEALALEFLNLKKSKEDLEKQMDDIKSIFKKNGSYSSNKVNVTVSYSTYSFAVKSFKEFTDRGFTEQWLESKGLLTTRPSGDRVVVKLVKPKKKK